MIEVFIGKLSHIRFLPKVNSFKFLVFYLRINIDNFEKSKNRMISFNKFNFFSIHWSDYGFKTNENPKKWLEGVLKKHKVFIKKPSYVLQTFPRILGYVFNPVNFWFCYEYDKQLLAIVAQVNNTFNESHTYCFKNTSNKNLNFSSTLTKNFSVSPFFKTDGLYNILFQQNNIKNCLNIIYLHENQIMLSAKIFGKKTNIPFFNLLLIFLFQSIKNTFKIYSEAFALYIKKIKYLRGKN
jgi:DUF1365 family protein